MSQGQGRIFAVIDGGTTNIRVILSREESIVARGYSRVGAKDRVVQRDEDVLITGIKAALRECLIRRFDGKKLKPGDIDWCLMLGMLTSNVGLLDLEHLTSPVGVEELAHGLVHKRLPELLPCPILFIRGVKNAVGPERGPHPLQQIDSMRGEETQTMGIIDLLPGLPLPALITFLSSHTKYVRVGEQGKITGALTTMSGQIFGAIKHHTYLSRYIPDDNMIRLEEIRQDDLWDGITAEREMGFLRAIHMPRFMDVVLKAPMDRCYSYLQGTLIGSDLRCFSFLREVMATDFKSLVFIGNNNRPALYREVFKGEVGLDVPVYALNEQDLEEAVVRGSLSIFRCAERSGLLNST
jgi:2-dehydro-3-deoxygalactonokinase